MNLKSASKVKAATQTDGNIADLEETLAMMKEIKYLKKEKGELIDKLGVAEERLLERGAENDLLTEKLDKEVKEAVRARAASKVKGRFVRLKMMRVDSNLEGRL